MSSARPLAEELLSQRVHDAEMSLLVQLAADPFQQIITGVQSQRSSLESLTGSFQQIAEQAWKAAGTEIYDFVDLIMRTNVPRKPINDILARPDIQQMLRRPFDEARTAAIDAARQAWAAGLDSGISSVTDAAHSAGLQIPDSFDAPDDSFLQKVISDIDSNTEAATQRFFSTIQNTPEDELQAALQKQTNDLGYRARYSVNVAGSRAAAQQQESAYQQLAEKNGVAIKKVWVTRFGPGTCRTCAKLHGTVRDLDKSFPSTAIYGGGKPPAVYGGLNGPPRHPNCRCFIALYLDSFDKGPVNSKTMKQFGDTWWAELLRWLGVPV